MLGLRLGFPYSNNFIEKKLPKIPKSLLSDTVLNYDSSEGGDAVLPLEQVINGRLNTERTDLAGVAEGWAKDNFGDTEADYAIDDNAQKITLTTSSTSTSHFSGIRIIAGDRPPVSEGDVIAIVAEAKVEGDVDARLLSRVNLSPSGSVGIPDAITSNTEYTTIIAFAVMPENAVDVNVRVGVRPAVSEGLGTGWIRNVRYYNLSAPRNAGGFGLGNEPTEAEFTDILEYNDKPYHEGPAPYIVNPYKEYSWFDYSGNSRHMRLVNFPSPHTSTTGFFNNRLVTDKVDDYGRVAGDISGLGEGLTFVAGFEITDGTDKQAIMTGGLTTQSLAMFVEAGNINFNALDNVAGTQNLSTAIANNTPNIAMITFNNVDKKVTAYLNHVKVGTSDALTGDLNLTDAIWIARDIVGNYAGAKFDFVGVIPQYITDDIHRDIYNRNCRRLGLPRF